MKTSTTRRTTLCFILITICFIVYSGAGAWVDVFRGSRQSIAFGAERSFHHYFTNIFTTIFFKPFHCSDESLFLNAFECGRERSRNHDMKINFRYLFLYHICKLRFYKSFKINLVDRKKFLVVDKVQSRSEGCSRFSRFLSQELTQFVKWWKKLSDLSVAN